MLFSLLLVFFLKSSVLGSVSLFHFLVVRKARNIVVLSFREFYKSVLYLRSFDILIC